MSTLTPSLFEAMDLTPIRSALRRILDDGVRAIHWHDPEGTFADALAELAVGDLEIIDVGAHPVLLLKRRLAGVVDTPFLLYTTGPEPRELEDPFLDVKSYARKFQADEASLRLGELGLAQRLDLVPWVQRRKKFLASAARTTKFQPLLDPRDQESDLDRKAIAVLAKATTHEPREVLLAVFDSLASLDADPQFWKELVTFDLEDAFWAMVSGRFSTGADVQTFRALLLRLFATDLSRAVRSVALGSSVRSLKLAAENEVAVFLSQWRDSSSRSASYGRLALEAAAALNTAQAIGTVDIDALVSAETFETVDQRILVGIRDEILTGTTDARRAQLSDLIQQRLASHWPRVRSAASHGGLTACYEAMIEAMTLMERVQRFKEELPNVAPASLAASYIQSWYLIDTAYRRFTVRAHLAAANNLDVLKSLASRLEDVYTVGFLAPFGSRWSEGLEAGLLDKWQIPSVPSQSDFFARQVQGMLDDGLKRVYVVISDALRYEAGAELADRLRRYRLSPEVRPMLSCLPSITALGMAALLPHSSLSISSGGQVLADGQSTAGLDARHAILAAHGGMAVRADDLKEMKRDEGRSLVRDARVVYIYHDVIDATGDKASSESDSFEAVDRALDQLVALVRRIIDQLNGSTVIVTADHGFLFTESSPGEIDKSSLGTKIDNAVKKNGRYVLATDLPDSGPFHRAELSKTARVEGDWQAAFPRSTQRFHLVGGNQYFHGGPLAQEVIVPVVIVKEKEGDAAKATQTRPVGITLATNALRVTTNQQSWRFLQTEPVDVRRKPLRASIGIYDGDRLVSDLQTVVFDSATDSLADCERRVRLSLSSETFDRTRHYDLTVRNADDGTEVLKQPLTLDIAFTNEF
jgi:uncharacterized protein (TIGR02687 family)